MLLAVTVVAVFIAYHLNWIRERRAFRAAEQEKAGAIGVSAAGPDETVPAPGLLRLFGEPGLRVLDVVIESTPTKADAARLHRAVQLFPETTILEMSSSDDASATPDGTPNGPGITLSGEPVSP